MSAQTIDRLAIAVAGASSRRRFLAAAGAAIGALVGTRIPVHAGATCSVDTDCDTPLICSEGFCQFPGCATSGLACSAHTDCCELMTCNSGACGVSPRCGMDGEGCGNECCSGLICLAGVCAPEPPAPPENTGGNGGGGGGNNGGEGSGGSTSGGSSGGGATTSGGVAVASLPSTGAGGKEDSKWGLTAAAMAGAAGLLGLARRRRLTEQNRNSEF